MHAVKKIAVTFRMRYQEGQQESVHRVPELRCPWCETTCGELESLMWHLQGKAREQKDVEIALGHVFAHHVPLRASSANFVVLLLLADVIEHIAASHDRFSYTLDKSLTMPEIYINVRASSGTEELHKSLAPHTDFCFLSARRAGGKDVTSACRWCALQRDSVMAYFLSLIHI